MGKAKGGAGQAGVALVELLVAMLLVALAVSAVAGSLLSVSRNRGRLERREQGLLHVNQLLQELKRFVSSDPSAQTADMAPEGCWNFRDPPPAGACLPGWALSDGAHDASFLLPGAWRAEFGARLTYTVSRPAGLPEVAARLNWGEPP